MNRILSQAIRKAVSEYSPKTEITNTEKRPDLFSLSNETELFQNEKGLTIKIDRSRDSKLTDFGRATLSDRYLGENESVKWDIKDKTLTINFMSPNKEVIGELVHENFDLEDSELAVYETKKLLNLLNITTGDVLLELEKTHKIFNHTFFRHVYCCCNGDDRIRFYSCIYHDNCRY